MTGKSASMILNSIHTLIYCRMFLHKLSTENQSFDINIIIIREVIGFKWMNQAFFK